MTGRKQAQRVRLPTGGPIQLESVLSAYLDVDLVFRSVLGAGVPPTVFAHLARVQRLSPPPVSSPVSARGRGGTSGGPASEASRSAGVMSAREAVAHDPLVLAERVSELSALLGGPEPAFLSLQRCPALLELEPGAVSEQLSVLRDVLLLDDDGVCHFVEEQGAAVVAMARAGAVASASDSTGVASSASGTGAAAATADANDNTSGGKRGDQDGPAAGPAATAILKQQFEASLASLAREAGCRVRDLREVLRQVPRAAAAVLLRPEAELRGRVARLRGCSELREVWEQEWDRHVRRCGSGGDRGDGDDGAGGDEGRLLTAALTVGEEMFDRLDYLGEDLGLRPGVSMLQVLLERRAVFLRLCPQYGRWWLAHRGDGGSGRVVLDGEGQGRGVADGDEDEA